MTKDAKCGDKPCAESGSNSEVCYKVKCEKRCEKKDCCVKLCPVYPAEEVVCMYRDAVVELHSEFILLGTAHTGSVDGETPLAPNSRQDIIVEGNGFFIKGHYIVAPAHLVLLPPSLTSTALRYPLISPSDALTGSMKDQMVRASRLLVSVFNVNGKGESFVYEADLVGVDGAGDIAVLKINYKKEWNRCNPCVEKCHPFFTFGSSRGSKDGEKVYLIGDYVSSSHNLRLFNAVGGVSDGVLSDHRYVDYAGYALAEQVLVSAGAYAYSSGLPILNGQGLVIGMQTSDLAAVADGAGASGGSAIRLYDDLGGAGMVAGPSEFFMRRVVKALIKGSCKRKCNSQLKIVQDEAGSYYRYIKAYAGLGYDIFTGVDYDYTVDYTSGASEAGKPRIRLDKYGQFLSSPACKQLVGVRVLGLAGVNPTDVTGVTNGLWYVPGGTGAAPLAPFLPVSPFLGRLQPGDVITHINKVALGDLHKQVAPSLVTWRLQCGDIIDVCYRRGGNCANTADNSDAENYDGLFTTQIALGEFPALMDYPWYAVSAFPLISPEFTLAAGQIVNPQVPALASAPKFRPAF